MKTVIFSLMIVMLYNSLGFAFTPTETIKPNKIIQIEKDLSANSITSIVVVCIEKQEFVIYDSNLTQVIVFDEKDKVMKPKSCKSNN